MLIGAGPPAGPNVSFSIIDAFAVSSDSRNPPGPQNEQASQRAVILLVDDYADSREMYADALTFGGTASSRRQPDLKPYA